MGTKWSNPLSFTVSFIKDVCTESSQQNLVFTEEEVNQVNAWLTSPDYPTLFHMYDYDFERDSLNNMILIDCPEPHATYTILADGYYPITYELEKNHCRVFWPEKEEGSDLIVPPKPRVEWFEGYYTIQYYMSDYPSKITNIICDGVEYHPVKTGEWLSMYHAVYEHPTYMYSNGDFMSYPVGSYYADGDNLFENSYMILLNKVKTLNMKYDYFGLFTNVEPQTVGGNVIGFTATFTANSPFAWTQQITQYRDVTDEVDLAFNVSSAERYREIYPVVKIHVPETAEDDADDGRAMVMLESVNDDQVMKLRLMKGATTTIDCEKCMITYVMDGDKRQRTINDSVSEVYYEVGKSYNAYVRGGTIHMNSAKREIYGDKIDVDDPDSIDWGEVNIDDVQVEGATLYLTVFGSASDISDDSAESDLLYSREIYWPKLRFGPNTFRITGECSLLMEYREPRKVGDW